MVAALAASVVLSFIAPGRATPAADVVQAEAERLVARAQARREEVGGAVDLIRLDRLGPWLPAGGVEERLSAAARDRRGHPLGRAVALWLVHGRALERLDVEAARAAADALGLLTGFAMRPGPAPGPTEPLRAADGWRPYPRAAGAGEIRLDAFLRPARETRATLVTRLVAPGGPAVLRLGYDDAVTVWLNGDEVYASPAEHAAWLDQAAVPVSLRPGDNRLVIEVRQRTGAWRLLVRVTDDAGEPLPGVEAHPDPWGDCPPPAPPRPVGPPPAHLWSSLIQAVDRDPPDAQALRDLAVYARVTGLPDADQALPRVAVEGAWVVDPSPRTLRAWLELLPEDQRTVVRAAHPPPRPIRRADVYAELELRLDLAWTHYYARRRREARTLLEGLTAEAPGFLPALRLLAIVHEDLGLPNTAASLLVEARSRHPRVYGLRRAYVGALRGAGRRAEQEAELETMVTDGLGGPDELYQLAMLRRDRGDGDGAVALLDRVSAARPELWAYALEAADVRLRAGLDRADARARLEALRAQIPGEPLVLDRLARLEAAEGDREAAAALLRRALEVDPGRSDLAHYLETLTGGAGPAPLGPPIETVMARASPEGPAAHVLYHHARTEVGPNGLAVRRVRRVVRLLTEEGARRFGEWEIAYVPGNQRLEVETARRIRAGEPPASPRRSDRDLSEPAYRLYYDLRAEVLRFRSPRPGDVIEVAWRLTDVAPDAAFPGYYGEVAYLQEAAPRAVSVVEVAGAAPGALHVEVVPHGVDVRRDGERIEARDVPGVPLEPDMPGPSSLRAYVHVSTADGWADLGRRYQALLDGRDRADAALAARARAWAGDATTAEEAVARLYIEVADRIRYVGLELGIHSFKPELPAVTLARGYGDCKDKATLLIALLRALGHEAHLALVRTRSQGAIAPRPASFAIFDHAVVYLPGLDRFVDPTVDRNDPWTLPPPDQGALAFVPGLDTAPRIIPAQPASHNRSAWTLDLRLDREGRARGQAAWETRGHPATLARRDLEPEGTRRERLERTLQAELPGARIRTPRVDGLKPARDPVRAVADVSLPPFPARGGGFDVPLGGAPWRLVERHAHAATRLTPLALDHRRREERTLRLTLPPGHRARLPAPIRLDGPFGHFEARAEGEGSRVTLRAALEITVLEVPPDRYGEFRRWLAAIDRALETPVEVRP